MEKINQMMEEETMAMGLSTKNKTLCVALYGKNNSHMEKPQMQRLDWA
jgi:hypothetical protein